MTRYYNNGKSTWGTPRPDMFPNGSSRRTFPEGRRDQGGSHRGNPDDGIPMGRPLDDEIPDDSVGGKLDRVLERLDKFDSWREETDHRFDVLEPSAARFRDLRLGFDGADMSDGEEVYRRKGGEKGFRYKNQGYEPRDRRSDDWGPRERRERTTSCWDPPEVRNPRHQFGGYDHPDNYQASCWDPPQRFNPQASGYDRNYKVKMTPPRFDGSNAANWISRVKYYFDHLMMPQAHRLHYAVMLFDPPASEWVFNYCANNDFVTWQEFLEDVRHRFDPQSFQNCFGLLAKLTQTGSVVEYHDTFEKYLNRIQGIPESELFTLFVAGLKPELQERLRLHRPSSLAAAMALTLEFATTQPDKPFQQPSSNNRRSWQQRDSKGQAGSTAGQPSSQANTSAAPSSSANRATEQPRLPQILVSSAEKAERSRLGLCWHCPEKWVMGHVCKQRLLCYADEDDESDQEVGTLVEQKSGVPVFGDVSHIHAMDAGHRSRPLKVIGLIQNREVCILIDTGSDRDFMHLAIAEQLHIPLSPIIPFRVYVGNGEALLCTHISKQTTLEVQEHIFNIDLHILPVHGSDIILGMDWLESLGKITADFAGKTLEFTHGDKPIVLKGVYPPPRRVSLHSLSSLIPSPSTLECYEILLLDPEMATPDTGSSEGFPDGLPTGVSTVLEDFRGVFSLPEGMPPRRPFDHRVHLLPGSRPVNVRPYRYPYFQKNEIERQVREMLE